MDPFCCVYNGHQWLRGSPGNAPENGPKKKEEAKAVKKGLEAKEGSSKKISETEAKDTTLKLQIPNIPPDTLAVPPKAKKEG